MISIAAIVFSKLNETPVTAFSLLAQRHLPTNSPNVKAELARRLSQLNVGFPVGRSTSSNLQLTVIEEDHELTTLIQPSVMGENSVFGHYHQQYQTPRLPEQEMGYFDVGVLIRSRLEKFQLTSEAFFGEVVVALHDHSPKGKADE
jgi:hypothetical protein